MLNLFLFLHADDTILFSEDVLELQNMINCIQQYIQKWDISVNVDKPKPK